MMKPVNIAGSFGWFTAGHSLRGVILCGTFGFEQLAAHRWWRDLGEGVAAKGCAVLRFDYPGQGDSEAKAITLAGALDAIRSAVRFLRDEAQVQEIVLVGLRLGGTLAALIAAEDGIDRLVLLAPFPRGRAYLREMEMQARLVDIMPDGGPLQKPPGVLSVGGFVVGPDLRQDLTQVDLCRLERCPAQRVLLLGPDPAGLAAKFTQLGSQVEAGDLSGLGGLLSDGQQSRMAAANRGQIIDFVSEAAPSRSAQLPPPRAADATTTGDGWSEEPVQFGAGLFGIQCHPHAVLPETPAVLFVNLGAYVHWGHGRQATTLARTLARYGITSMRMDLGGVGDSADRPDGELPLYKLDAVADIRAAIDMLTRSDSRPVIVVGTCNGAYLAFHASCQDPRIATGVLINLYCFDWELTHGGEPYGAKPVRHISAYATMLLSWETWRRLLSGTTPIGTIVYSLVRRGSARLIGKLVKSGQLKNQAKSIAARIADLRCRGAKLVMIYSAGDLGLVDLRTQLGSLESAAAILGQPVRIVADVDHAFSAEPAQAMLLQELRDIAADWTASHQASSESASSLNGRTLEAL